MVTLIPIKKKKLFALVDALAKRPELAAGWTIRRERSDTPGRWGNYGTLQIYSHGGTVAWIVDIDYASGGKASAVYNPEFFKRESAERTL